MLNDKTPVAYGKIFLQDDWYGNYFENNTWHCIVAKSKEELENKLNYELGKFDWYFEEREKY